MASSNNVSELYGTTFPCFKGRVILLTGIGQTGSSKESWGNGSATTRLLCANGAKVFGCDLNAAAAENTRSRLAAEFGEDCVSVITADVTRADDVQRLVDACLERYGHIGKCLSMTSFL